MQLTTVQALINRYLESTITAPELEQLHALLTVEADKQIVIEALSKELRQTTPDTTYKASSWQPVLQRILQVDKPEIVITDAPTPAPIHRIHFLKTGWFRYAAAVLLIVGLGSALFLLQKAKRENTIAFRKKNGSTKDVLPGGDKAVLTLADGTTIVLDSAANGQLASRSNVRIVKLNNGQLKFIIAASQPISDTIASQLNTISTPKGGQYQLELPDGTHIWLNALTSLHFPTAFGGKNRPVQLNGEAYFEVAKDTTHPFEVVTNNTTIEVLGTHFNINAYTDESVVTTTLLEGKVAVKNGDANTTVLLPGYQSLSRNGNTSINKNADTEEAVAWKNGRFQFTGADVKTIMRQIGRWYNVEVKYVADIPAVHLSGEMPRTLTLQQIMKVLDDSGIAVWLEDNTLYVAPKP